MTSLVCSPTRFCPPEGKATMGVTLDRFEPSAMLKPGSVVVITARRNSGKTVLLRDLMFHLRKSIDVTMAMTQSVSSADMLREHVPSSCVCSNRS